MLIKFELSMPNVGSWNGHWSGERNLYAKVVNFGRSKKSNEKAKQILDKGYYRYDFGDGWSAAISVKQVDAKEVVTIRRKSRGFCGYDWMIESIKERLEIKTGNKS